MKTRDVLLPFFIWIYLAALSHEVKATDPAIEMTGDGNCWFRALNFCHQGNEDGHHHLRQDITLFMWQRRELYRPLIRNEGNIDLFIINQRNDRVYAEGITLQGSADFLGMDLYITIHHDGRDVITYWIRPSGNQHTTTNWLHVRQNGENHFDVIGSSNHNVGVRPDENTRLWYDGVSDHDRLHTASSHNLGARCDKNMRLWYDGVSDNDRQYPASNHNVRVRPDENTKLWYDGVSDHDRPHTVHQVVDNMKEELKIHEERKVEDTVIQEEETNEPGVTVGEDDLDLIRKSLDIRVHHDVDNMKEELKVHEERKEEDIVNKEEETREPGDTVGEDDLELVRKKLAIRVHHDVYDMKEELKVHEEMQEEDIVNKEEETKEPGDTVGEDDLDLIMKNLDLRAGRPATTDENQITDTNLDLKKTVKLKLPNLQPTSELYQGWTIQDEESEDSDYNTPPVSPTEDKNTELEFKTPPQSPVENVQKLSDLFVELDVEDTELTEPGADKEDNLSGDIVDVNKVIESEPDEVDGKTQADLKRDNNKDDNPKWKKIENIDELKKRGAAGGLAWSHFAVFRSSVIQYHHHYVVLNSNETTMLVLHLHPHVKDRFVIGCEVQEITFNDSSTWNTLLDFEVGVYLIERECYPETDDAELFQRLGEVSKIQDYSLTDNSKFYCETVVTYLLTGKKISRELGTFLDNYPFSAKFYIKFIDGGMILYRNKYIYTVIWSVICLITYLPYLRGKIFKSKSTVKKKKK